MSKYIPYPRWLPFILIYKGSFCSFVQEFLQHPKNLLQFHEQVNVDQFATLDHCRRGVHCLCSLALMDDLLTQKSQPRFATLNAQNNPICVHASPNPNGAGHMDAQDCADALGRLWDRVLPYGYIQWTFWECVAD